MTAASAGFRTPVEPFDVPSIASSHVPCQIVAKGRRASGSLMIFPPGSRDGLLRIQAFLLNDLHRSRRSTSLRDGCGHEDTTGTISGISVINTEQGGVTDFTI